MIRRVVVRGAGVSLTAVCFLRALSGAVLEALGDRARERPALARGGEATHP
jgi:hypothetical protein